MRSRELAFHESRLWHRRHLGTLRHHIRFDVNRVAPPRLVAAGVPPAFAGQFTGGGGGSGVDLQGTGDLGERILASVPAEQQPLVQPLIPGIVQAIYDSISIAIASSFWVGIGAAILAAVLVLVLLPEVPMRDTFEMEEAGTAEPAPA
jgi:hypothetical protein